MNQYDVGNIDQYNQLLDIYHIFYLKESDYTEINGRVVKYIEFMLEVNDSNHNHCEYLKFYDLALGPWTFLIKIIFFLLLMLVLLNYVQIYNVKLASKI